MKNYKYSFFRIVLLSAFATMGNQSIAQEAEHPTHQATQSARVNLSSCAKPQYPRAALRVEAQGTVTLAFLIGLDGSVAESKVYRSSGSADLDEAARTAIAKCKFDPAVVDGLLVEAWTKVQYVWTLKPRSPY